MKIKNFILLGLMLLTSGLYAQTSQPPTDIVTGTFLGKTIPLRDFPLFDASKSNAEPKAIIANASITPTQKNETTTVIENIQTEFGKIVAQPPLQNFIGASSSESNAFPPDPTGAVGPNHYVHSVNSLVKIFDKTGTLLVGPVSLASFLGIGSNAGDPIVLYDQLADRWVVSEFGAPTNSLAIGVSETNDPTGAYNVYQYVFPAGFPDYPKYSTWHDGYYGTVNLGGATTQGFVMERDEMLIGGPDPQILIFNFPQIVVNPNQVKSPVAANILGSAIDTSLPGYVTYLQDDAWNGVSADHLKVWEIDVDWDNLSNSTISQPLVIPTDPFDAGELFGNGNGAIRQPGTSQRLAGHGGIISFSANYRTFADHNSWLITFNTFIDNNETGGIRWIELRNDTTNDWSIFQEGTYSIADGHSRLMSSSAMDAAGNIGMAYTTASVNLPVSLRYTGRFNNDPLGEMTLDETVIIDGPGVRTNSNRYGDYSHMTMDPDNFTFWFTSDYFSSNNNWRTQIASFALVGGFADDVGPSAIIAPESGLLTNAETVTVSIRNFGTEAQTSVPLELRLDGVLVASETFNGTIASFETEDYTFSQTVDLSTSGETYTLEVTTGLAGDEFTPNNVLSKDVINFFQADIGVDEILSPATGLGLGTETISVNLKNFGFNPQSGFNVQYSVNGGTPVVEAFTGTLDFDEEEVFDFATQFDFTDLGNYTIVASTVLSGDQDSSNDEATTDVESQLCSPSSNCSGGIGFRLVSIAEINNPSGCEGYGDFTDQIANVAQGSINDITFGTERGNMNVMAWIDFNDDLFFHPNEVVVANFVIAPGQGGGNYTETVSLNIPVDAPIGEHRMRVKSSFNEAVEADACLAPNNGETEDYTINVGSLGVEDFEISNGELIVTTLANKQFEVILNTDYDGGVYMGVFNMLGQEVGFNKQVPRNNGAYKVALDMSKMSSGVYLIRMGGHGTTSYKTARIIVN